MHSEVPATRGQIAHGLIEHKGDTVRLIYALPGGEVPVGFRTRPKQIMVTLKNVKR